MYYELLSHIKYEIIDDQCILVDPVQGHFIASNMMGFCILKAIENGYSSEQIFKQMADYFKLPLDESKSITEDFCKQLLDLNIIRTIPTPDIIS